jgi:hypothetical protein
MVDVTPRWVFVSMGFESAPVAIQGIDPWKHESRSVSSHEEIVISHASYPSESHAMFVYTIGGDGRTIAFAAGEYSNGVRGVL